MRFFTVSVTVSCTSKSRVLYANHMENGNALHIHEMSKEECES